MEILAIIEYKGWYTFIITILCIASVFFLSLLVYGLIDEFQNGFSLNGVAALITCLLLVGGCGYIGYNLHKDGAYVEYKAKITDFNEVYNNGYKIIDQEGEIYILEKED